MAADDVDDPLWRVKLEAGRKPVVEGWEFEALIWVSVSGQAGRARTLRAKEA